MDSSFELMLNRRMKNLFVITFFFFTFTSVAMAKPTEYHLNPKSWVTFDVIYTMGTHTGKAVIDHLNVLYNPDDLKSASGEFVMPIAKMTSGDAKRDCHMREALGLDYAQSEFPEKHICNEANELPSSGKNAVVFPLVIFTISGIEKDNDKTYVIGQWNIHGVSRSDKVPVKMNADEGKLHVQGDTNLKLSDFNVQVKSAKALFLTISVKDEIRAHFDLWLDP